MRRRPSKKSGAVTCPERRKQEPFSRWPSVAKKTPPSRFQTTRLGTLEAFFLVVSGWLTRSSMRDCGGTQAFAPAGKNCRHAVHRQRSTAFDTGLAKIENISWSQDLSLARAGDCGGGKKFRRPD